MSRKKIWGPPSESQMKEGLGFVLYEAMMLAFTANLLKKPESINVLCPEAQGDDYDGLSNAVLESFLVHFRALREFFEKHPNMRPVTNREEDQSILSSDYDYDDGPIELKWLDELTRQRLNKDLAHLDYSRAKREREALKKWHTVHLFTHMKKELMKFFTHVMNSKRRDYLTENERWEPVKTTYGIRDK